MSLDRFIVKGGQQLGGTIKPQGSKNEAMQIMCASLLTNEPMIIENIPDIKDVQILMQLLRTLGVAITKVGHGIYQFCSRFVEENAMYTEDFRVNFSKIRGSIMVLGPLLTRFKEVVIAKPGGDMIGQRSLHAHFEGLEQLGVSFDQCPVESIWTAEHTTLKGACILMSEASVTGTANVIMAASMAVGRTTIYHAACEPQIQQLCNMLVAMGACITGIGSNLITINGVKHLVGTKHTVSPDMIEIGSFIGLAVATKSALTIKDVPLDMFRPIWNFFRKFGILLERGCNELHIPKQHSYCIEQSTDGEIPNLSDSIWPGFPADLISIAIVIAIHAQGNILIHQKMFDSRLYFVNQLREMGARLVLCDPHRVHVVGLGNEKKLHGINLRCNDIRSGMALLIAALASEGTSTIENVGQIDRGYENIVQRLNNLGSSIVRE